MRLERAGAFFGVPGMIVQADAATWLGCYDSSWAGFITDESFAHPAKAAYGLAEHIVKHGLARGYWKPNDLVGDPFCGVGCFGIMVAAHGMRFVGVELEEHFHALCEKNFALNPWCRDGVCRCVCGDSRNFASLVGECAAVVTSAPYADAVHDGCGIDRDKMVDGRGGRNTQALGTHYGESPGQLASLPVGSIDAVLTSPPWSSQAHEGGDTPTARGIGADGKRHRPYTARGLHEPGGPNRLYGQTEGQIGSLPVGSLDSILTSPPYAESVKGEHGERESAADSRDLRDTAGGSMGRSQRYGGYGVTDGQVGAMPTGDLSAIVTSPPYEGTHVADGKASALAAAGNARMIRDGAAERYGDGNGQLGNTTGDTYWKSVAAIYDQCRLALKPGGVLCCVMGNYVKAGKIVDLCGQTWTLLQHIDFEPLERIKALKTTTVEDAGLFEPMRKTKSKVSFFRRLAIQKGSPDPGGEGVLFVRRP